MIKSAVLVNQYILTSVIVLLLETAAYGETAQEKYVSQIRTIKFNLNKLVESIRFIPVDPNSLRPQLTMDLEGVKKAMDLLDEKDVPLGLKGRWQSMLAQIDVPNILTPESLRLLRMNSTRLGWVLNYLQTNYNDTLEVAMKSVELQKLFVDSICKFDQPFPESFVIDWEGDFAPKCSEPILLRGKGLSTDSIRVHEITTNGDKPFHSFSITSSNEMKIHLTTDRLRKSIESSPPELTGYSVEIVEAGERYVINLDYSKRPVRKPMEGILFDNDCGKVRYVFAPLPVGDKRTILEVTKPTKEMWYKKIVVEKMGTDMDVIWAEANEGRLSAECVVILDDYPQGLWVDFGKAGFFNCWKGCLDDWPLRPEFKGYRLTFHWERD